MEAVAAEYGTKIFCRIRELVNQDISAIQKLMAIYDFFIDAAQQQKALFLEIQNAGGGEVHEKIILDVGGKLIPYISQIIKRRKKERGIELRGSRFGFTFLCQRDDTGFKCRSGRSKDSIYDR